MNRKQRRAEQKQGCSRGARGWSSVTQEAFAHALRHYEAGRLDEVVACYGRVLAVEPGHAEAHNNLGVVLTDQGLLDAAAASFRRALALRPDYSDAHNNLGTVMRSKGRLNEAAASFARALALRPDYPEAHNNLGVAMQDLGRWGEAAASFGRALALRPDYPDAHNNLGIAMKQEGRLDEAAACYRRAVALRPTYAEAHNNLGVAMRDQGRLDEAVASFGHALALRPDYPEARNNLGSALGRLGRLDEAVACYDRVVAFSPRSSEAHNNLGIALMNRGRLDEAAASFDQALALRPDYPEAHNNLGIVRGEQGRHDEAAVSFGRALALRADYPEAHNNLGVAMRDQRRLDEAVASYGRALALRPGYAEAHNNLGVALMEQQHLAEAVASFGRALVHQPDYPDAHQNLAMALLARGDLAAGWEEYEWRWKTPHMMKARRDFAQPQWRGDAAEGRTLLIHAEQGFGDTLQFCRYAPLAAARGLRVVLEVQKSLVRLLRGLPRIDEVVAQGEALPHFDFHCPMLSLPLALAGSVAGVPSFRSYLRAGEAQIAAWRARLSATGERDLRVGLAWAGNPALAADRRRSLAPERLAPLLGLRGVRFVSLQKDAERAPEASVLLDPIKAADDFADTAALIANLDLVISVDTAVAHLAAALGKPVWLLNRFDSCWRWPAGRRDSPWYPTLRLYHQPRPGDWDAVLAEAARDLRVLASSRCSGAVSS